MFLFNLIYFFLLNKILCEGLSVWTDPISGTKYDFSALQRDPNNPWIVKDATDNGLFSMLYYFNIGNVHSRQCKGQKVAVSEVLEVMKQPTDTCEILGRAEASSFGLLEPGNPNKGIYILYGAGDGCNSKESRASFGKPRETKFKLYCAPKQSNFVLDHPGGTQGTTKCLLEFKIESPAGCPGGSYGSGSSVAMLLWIVFIFTSYLILGTIYNIKKNNLSGKEAIPNIEFWRGFPGLVQDGAAYSLSKCKITFAIVKRRIKGSHSSYNDI